MANTIQYNSAGLSRVYWAANNTAGYPAGAAGSIANGSDASMAWLVGAENFNLPVQAPRVVNVLGDNDVQATYYFNPAQAPSGNLVLANIDLTFFAKAVETKVYADGVYSGVVIQPSLPIFNNMTFVINSDAKSAQSGSVGNAGFRVGIYNRVQVVPIGDQGRQDSAAASFTHQLVANKSDKLPWGLAYSDANHGTTRGSGYEFFSPYPICLHTHVSNASDVDIVLTYEPAGTTAAEIQVWRNGTLLTITSDWTVSGSTITLAAAGTAGDVVVVRYQHL